MKYSQYFEQKTRVDTGNAFTCLTNEAPEDLKSLLRVTHIAFECGLPNDWLYETIFEAFESLEENDIYDISIEADIYNNDLIEWLHNSYAIAQCDEAYEELGSEDNKLLSRIATGQSYMKELIYHMVDCFMKLNKERTE
jgi:hypothetical protein